jgi:hypothetical protein
VLIDPTGLGYTIQRGEILVHYPAHSPEHPHGAGWPIGPVPATYALDPPNAITAARMTLWTELRKTAEHPVPVVTDER